MHKNVRVLLVKELVRSQDEMNLYRRSNLLHQRLNSQARYKSKSLCHQEREQVLSQVEIAHLQKDQVHQDRELVKSQAKIRQHLQKDQAHQELELVQSQVKIHQHHRKNLSHRKIELALTYKTQLIIQHHHRVSQRHLKGLRVQERLLNQNDPQ